MHQAVELNQLTVARAAGWSLLIAIIVGIVTALFVSPGIDINLSADVAATANNMLEAETRLRAKAYLACGTFGLEALFGICLYLLLRQHGALLALWALVITLAGSVVVLFGAVYSMNAAEIASNSAYTELPQAQRVLVTSLQATSDYTSFHLGLVISAFSNALFFYLFYRSVLIPKIISAWGVFASLFVSITIVARDFIPALGNNTITAAFMLCNMIALISTALYLVINGVRSET